MFRNICALLILSAALGVAAESPIVDYAPPGTTAVIGVHLRSVIDSSLVQSLGADLFKTAGAKWTSASPFPGVDPLKDIDELVIATAGEGPNPPALVICRGRFPVEALTKGAQTYHGVPILKVQDGTAVALLNSAVVIGGEMKDVRDAIDRNAARAAGLRPALAQRIAQLSGKYDVWGAGTMPKTFHPPAGGPDGLGSLDRFEFGLALNQGLQLAGTVHVRNPADAQKLAAMLQLFEMMAKAQPDSSGTRIESHLDNGALSLSLSVPEEALKKAIEQQRGNIAQALSRKLAGSLSAPGSASSAAQPKTAPAKAVDNSTAPEDVQIIKDKDGNTVQVILPGKK